jgi:hypothetical protein
MRYKVFLIAAIHLMAFKTSEVISYRLKNGDQASIQYKPDNARHFLSSINRSSYDGTKYSVLIDSLNRVKVSNLREAVFANSNDLQIFGCNGSLTQSDSGELTINLKSENLQHYIISLQKPFKIDTYGTSINVNISARNADNTPAQFLIPNWKPTLKDPAVIAIPEWAKNKVHYKPKQSAKNISRFTRFVVTDESGKMFSYPAGDYVICSGKSITTEQ